MVGSVILARQPLIADLDARINREFVQKRRELDEFAKRASIRRRRALREQCAPDFLTFLQRNDEVITIFVDREPYRRRSSGSRTDRELVAQWADLQRPTRGRDDIP